MSDAAEPSHTAAPDGAAKPNVAAGPHDARPETQESVSEAPSSTPPHTLPRQIRHDLRSYLNQVLGYSDLLIDEVKERGQDDLVSDLERIHRAGKNLLDLINEHVDPVTRRADNAPAEESRKREEGKTANLPSPGLQNLESQQAMLLVVEDDAANRDLLSRYLQRQGCQAVLVESGEQAMEQLAARPFDLVLLDVMMPGQNGFEVLQNIKENPALRHLPVIMISAQDALDSVVRCIQLGAEDYLPKPLDPVLLQARVNASLEKKRMRDREQALFSQLEANYQQLQQLEKLRDDLVHMIVHDMRTPLTSLLTGLQTMEALGEASPDQREFLEMATVGGLRLLGMINDLLDISKMESGSLPLEMEPLTAMELVEAAVAQVETLAQEKQLALQSEIASDLPRFFGDRDKLQRILVNLIGNAIKHTPEGGSITLRASQDGDCVHLSVMDTGEGIPSEAFGRIFEKFGQVETRKGGRRMSTGLGLTFCKMAVEAHGGRIGVESEPGQGSTFFFHLPLKTENQN